MLGENTTNISKQRALTLKEANHILSFISKNIGSRLRAVILPLRLALETPQLEHCVETSDSQYKKQLHP